MLATQGDWVHFKGSLGVVALCGAMFVRMTSVVPEVSCPTCLMRLGQRIAPPSRDGAA